MFDEDVVHCSRLLSCEAMQLWQKITLVVCCLRGSRRRGRSVRSLGTLTKLSDAELRLCIRLIVDLGGEVQLVSQKGKENSEPRFVLHN